MNLALKLLKTSLFLPLLFSCATPQNLEKLPKRQIDRPYTFKQGLSVWRTQGVFSISSETGRDTQNNFAVFPWFWEQALTDNLTLNWAPLPTEIKLQIFSWERTWLGWRINLLGSPFFQFQEYNFTPYVQFDFLHRVTPNFGLTMGLLAQIELRRSNEPTHGIFEYRLGGLFQALERLSVECYGLLRLELGSPRTGYLPYFPTPFTSPSVRFPLGIRSAYLILDPWEIALDYRNYGLGYQNSYSSQQLSFSLTHFF